jgi:hypothetical protein
MLTGGQNMATNSAVESSAVESSAVSTKAGFKLSASEIAWDLECPRCFYLSHVHGIEQPSKSVYPKADNRYKEFFEDKDLSSISPAFPKGKLDKAMNVTSLPKAVGVDVVISGRTPNLLKLPDGTYALISLRDKVIKPNNLSKYETQMNAYAWAVMHNQKSDKRYTISQLGFIIYDLQKLLDGINPAECCEWQGIELKQTEFEDTLKSIGKLLRKKNAPDFTDDCDFCKRDKAIMETVQC